MVTVTVNEITTIPQVYANLQSPMSGDPSTDTSGFINSNGTPFTLPDGYTMYYQIFAKNNTSGPTLQVRVIDSITTNVIVNAFVGVGNAGTTQTSSYKNTSGQDMTVQMQYSYTGSGSTQTNFQSALLMNDTNIDLCEQLNLGSLGSGTTQLVRNQKQYINKWYVICENVSSSVVIDGIQCTFANNPTEINIGTISNSQTFNWSYNASNRILLAFTGAKFQISA
jgi:hypothetical protein